MSTLKRFSKFLLLAATLLASEYTGAQPTTEAAFPWPEGKKVAISLSFDDARLSQVDSGMSVLDQYGAKATFYLVPSTMEQRLEGWKKAVAGGQEIGNHSLTHPCTGNFPWSRQNALEDYTLEKMSGTLKEASNRIEQLLGVKSEVFAYPCGQTFVGRGAGTKSYVPVVAEQFLTGRLWLSEGPNDPRFCDFAQLTGMEMDGKSFEQIRQIIDDAKNGNMWLVLAGHEMKETGPQATSLLMLRKLIEYAQDKSNGVWLAPVGTVAKYIKTARAK
jgi:peptidoglycan/xylan/chitin deacetylase (PgdA/CDA1 family)